MKKILQLLIISSLGFLQINALKSKKERTEAFAENFNMDCTIPVAREIASKARNIVLDIAKKTNKRVKITVTIDTEPVRELLSARIMQEIVGSTIKARVKLEVIVSPLITVPKEIEMPLKIQSLLPVSFMIRHSNMKKIKQTIEQADPTEYAIAARDGSWY